MSTWTLETTDTPLPAESEVLDRGLHFYNLGQLGPELMGEYGRLAVFARDADGTIIGGVHGDLVWEWLYIRTLWVNEAWRSQGIGSRLLQAVEEAAIARGVYHVHLETTDFQALDFYRRYGYSIFGQIEGKPTGHTWYFIQKALA